jgi:uncharacterized surface protein with fasciclin (FAS1) repeats
VKSHLLAGMSILLLLMASATVSADIFDGPTIGENATMDNVSNVTTMPGNATENQTVAGNQTANMTIVEVIGQQQNLTILATAINETDLVGTLSAGGPYTVFAPTDEAFQALGNETVDALLNNTTRLTAILQYHVVEGNYTSQQLMELLQQNMTRNQTMNVTGNQTANQTENMTRNQTMNVTGNQTTNQTGNMTQNQTMNMTGNQTMNQTENMTQQQAAVMLQTLLGPNLTVSLNQSTGQLMVNNATVIMTDINASNGVVHVIDAVLIPPENVTGQVNQTGIAPSIVDVIAEDENLSTLGTAIRTANLTGTLDAAGPYTIFAPTNDAFGQMTPENLSELLNNDDLLATVLQYHVVAGEYTADDIIRAAAGGNATNNTTASGSTTLQTLLGENITITVKNGEIMIDNATVEVADIDAGNGVIHTIDAVLLPVNVTLQTPEAGETMENMTQNQTTANQTENTTANQTVTNQTG